MSHDPSQQPTPDAPTSSPDGHVPPVIPNGGQSPALDSGSVIPDGGQSPGVEASAPITTTEGVSDGAKPELPPTVSEKAVEARVQQLRMQRLQKAENPTPEEDRERAIYELQMPWWQKAWRWTGLGDKNGWDWAQLLAVPVMLAIMSWGLSEYAKSRDQLQQQADKEKEQALADDKAKQDTLVKYLDDMAGSLKDGLLDAAPGSKAFIIAQSRTVLALQSLDRERRYLVLQFLKASGLNQVGDDKDTQKFLEKLSQGNLPEPPKNVKLGLLYGAQMAKANLANSDLSGATLIGADLSGANFECNPPDSKEPEHCSDLSFANLRGAGLYKANLSGANLWSANLWNAGLTNANLGGANLSDAYLEGADLSDADLNNAFLHGAQLYGAQLYGADLRGANLRDAHFNGAKLADANFSGAILLHTDLLGAINLTPQQLTGDNAPLLCNVRFPEDIKGIDPYRDCDRIPQELMKRYPNWFPDLQSAKDEVNTWRQLKFP